jgi:transcriptional repressor NrdR
VQCPFCGDESDKVVDTRLARDGAEIRRRRECLECGRRFTTRERVEAVLPRVRKRDQRREDYVREKLLLGIERACQKRPISAELIERIVDRIERRLQEIGEREVASRYLGERAMEELTAIDSLAAVRYASVFRNFQSTAEYADFFAALEDSRPAKFASAPAHQSDADPDDPDAPLTSETSDTSDEVGS